MGLKREIDKKGEYYERETSKWESRITNSLILLLIFSLSIFLLQLYQADWKVGKVNYDFSFYLRHFIVSPVVFYLYFSVKQYQKNRKILDHYLDRSTFFSLFREKIA